MIITPYRPRIEELLARLGAGLSQRDYALLAIVCAEKAGLREHLKVLCKALSNVMPTDIDSSIISNVRVT